MLDSDSLFVIYLTTVRIGTIAAGVLAIRYGYKLFAAGVFKVDSSTGATELSGHVGKYELKFKTAAPGAVLGFFGATIIVFVMVAAPPELARQTKIKHSDTGAAKTTTVETTETMRGEDAALGKLLVKAAEFNEKGQTAEAIRNYQEALRMISEPMHELARLYMGLDRFKQARDLMEVAVMMNPADPDFAITLEKIKNSM